MVERAWLSNVVVGPSAARRLPSTVIEEVLASWEGRYVCERCGGLGDAADEPVTLGADDDGEGVKLWFADTRCEPGAGADGVVGHPPGAATASPAAPALSAAAFVRPGRPRAAVVWSLRGVTQLVGAGDDPVDGVAAVLLGEGLSLVMTDWADEDLAPAPGWAVEWDEAGQVALSGPDRAWFEAPLAYPEGWIEHVEASGEVAVLAAGDLDLRAPVGSLDGALAAGRLVGGRVAARQRPPEPGD